MLVLHTMREKRLDNWAFRGSVKWIPHVSGASHSQVLKAAL